MVVAEAMQLKISTLPLFFTTKDIEKHLGIKRTHLWQLQKQGYLLPISGGINEGKIRKTNLIPIESVLAFYYTTQTQN